MERRTFVAGLAGAFVVPALRAPTDVDDTRVVQDAMNECVTQGVPLVLYPQTYVCRSLNVPNGLVMTGNTPGGYGVKIGAHPVIALKAGTNDHLLKGAPDVAHVRITGVHFDGNKNNNDYGDIIHLDPATPREAQWHIRDCFIEAAPSNGIFVGAGRRAVQISDSTVNYNRNYGMALYGSDAHVDRCIVGTNGVGGLGIGGTVVNVNECDIYNNKTGITVFSTLTKVMIRGNRIDRQSRGVYVSPKCKDILITHNIFHMNARDVVDDSRNATVTVNIHGAE